MNISTFQSNLDFFKNLYFHEEWNDEDCRNEILEAIEEANERIEKAFGESIHNLHAHKPSVEAVEKVVKKFPSTLSHVHEDDGRIPIQYAAFSDAFEYVPVLAKEGMKHKVGGEDARGGLLTIDPYEDRGWNTLRLFVKSGAGEEDVERVNILKELRKSGMLVKKDIREQEFLSYSCWEDNRARFEYFASWDPDALIDMVHQIDFRQLSLFFKASFKYHPFTGGLLFEKDDDGIIAFDTMCAGNGTKETMNILYEILTPNSDYPILHYVLVNAPQHRELFMEYFPWAYHLKDQNNRTLHQAVLAAGPDVMNLNKQLFASLSDNRIREKDPVTTLYPFAAMAVGEHADLKNTFYLLRRNPSVLDRHARARTDHCDLPKRKKKRKRGD